MNTYTVAHAMHRALDRLLVADAASRAALLETPRGPQLAHEALTAMVQYERLREHAWLLGPTDALARVLYEASWSHGPVPQEPWDSATTVTREHWRKLAQAVLFSGIVTA